MIKFLIGVVVGIAGTLLYIERTKDDEWEDVEELDEELDDIKADLDRSKRENVYEETSTEYRTITNVSELNTREKTPRKNKPMVVIDKAEDCPAPVDGVHERVEVITQEQFYEDFEDFDKFTVEYDVSNDILMDESGDPVGVDVLASKKIIDWFYYDNECDVVYIRNFGLTLDYEIIKVDGHGNQVASRPRTMSELEDENE